jgi:hypothetical protein
MDEQVIPNEVINVKHEQTMEESLRKNNYLVGKWIRLGDGEKWCVSPMPLGKSGDSVLNALEKLFEIQDEMKSLVVGDKSEKELLEPSRRFLVVARDFAISVLKVNYPDITKDYFDRHNLVNVVQIREFIGVAQGQDEIAQVIGDMVRSGELEKNVEAAQAK